MNKKSPLVAALLNFILPGIGFIYIGGGYFISGGILVFFVSIISSMSGLISSSSNTENLFLSILAGLTQCVAFSILGYGIAIMHNSIVENSKKLSESTEKEQSVNSGKTNDNVIFCSKCGEKITDDSIFCKKCGNKVR